MRFFKVDLDIGGSSSRCDGSSTRIERMPNGRLCTVRRRNRGSNSKPKELVEVDYESERVRVHLHEHKHEHHHKHTHDHHHFLHYDGTNSGGPPVVQGRPPSNNPESRDSTSTSPHPPPTTPLQTTTSACSPHEPITTRPPPQYSPDRSCSPVIEVREPRNVSSTESCVNHEAVPVERFRLRKVRNHRKPASNYVEQPTLQSRQSDRQEYAWVKLPKRRESRRHHPRHHQMPEPETAVWNEEFGAWTVKRTPRVRFA